MSEGLIYTAPRPTWKSSILSILTLSAVFLCSLFYWLLVPLFLYLYAWSVSFWVCVALLLSTIWWHKMMPSIFENHEYWRSNRVFEAWRSYFGLRVYVDRPEGPIHSPAHLLSVESTLPPLRGGELIQGGKKILYTFVPHGLFPFGLVLVSGILFKNQKLKIGIASNMFYIPVFCVILRLLGCVEANKEIFNNTEGTNIVLVPDGIAGAFVSDREYEVLYLRKREGFIREALSHGYDIVPVYCFGHTQLYDVYGWQELSRRLRFALVWFWGQSPAIWLPHARNVSVVVGIIPPPSGGENDNPQWTYLKSIKDLYDKYKYIVPDWDAKKELKII